MFSFGQKHDFSKKYEVFRSATHFSITDNYNEFGMTF